jgi:hypothetical protein
MKKIVLAFDGSNFSKGSFEFVRRLNELQPVLVTGVFIPQVDYSNLWSYSTAATGAGGLYVPLVEKEETESVESNIKQFERLCQSNGIKYRVHTNFFDFALPELKKETRFADVLILSSELFYNDQFEYLQDVLHIAECPVLVVPEYYNFPTNNVLAYDGSSESVFAIKQFAYIFPELAKNETLLVYAEDNKETRLPAMDNVIELATQHYENLDFYKLNIDPKKYFKAWLEDKQNILLVSGSFGRSGISHLFKKSFVYDILREHKYPVFVAHK